MDFEDSDKLDEEKPTEIEEKKTGWFSKQWGKIVTGATCLLVGIGITAGADAVAVKDVIEKAVAARAVAEAVAVASKTAIDSFIEKSKAVKDEEGNKVAAIAEAVAAGTEAGKILIDGAKEVKEATEDIRETLGETASEVKEAVNEVKDKIKEKKEEIKSKKEEKKDSAPDEITIEVE